MNWIDDRSVWIHGEEAFILVDHIQRLTKTGKVEKEQNLHFVGKTLEGSPLFLS